MARLPEAITTTSPAAHSAAPPVATLGRTVGRPRCRPGLRGLLAAGPLEVDLVVHRPSVQGPAHRVPGRAVLAADLRQERVGRPGGLLRPVAAVTVTSWPAIRVRIALQRLAVPLPEGGALALAVVREDDELVRPRACVAGSL